MAYDEDDFLMLSGIQHFAFCRRQWALIHIEQLWEENLRTVEGHFLHENCHDGYSSESRKDVLISRGVPIFARTLSASGECDIVEFRKSAQGITLHGREGRYTVYPVEYKHGAPKDSDIDALQLVAQAICLEGMLGCEITDGALFYGKTKRWQKVVLTDELKSQVRALFGRDARLLAARPRSQSKAHNKLQCLFAENLRLPKLYKIKSVSDYRNKISALRRFCREKAVKHPLCHDRKRLFGAGWRKRCGSVRRRYAGPVADSYD